MGNGAWRRETGEGRTENGNRSREKREGGFKWLKNVQHC
jgi:hypothetical protein